MKLTVTKGATSQTVYLFIRDSSATTGAGLTGLVYNSGSLVASYVRPLGSRTAITLATQTVTGAWSSGGFVEVDATNMPGVYRMDVPDAVFASGVNSAIVMLKGATNMESSVIEFALEAVNAQDAVRGGMTALPNANAEAAGGLYTRGTGAGQINQANNGQIDTNAARTGGTTNTGRDVGASVLLSSGTGTGQLSLSAGLVTLAGVTHTGAVIPTVTTLTGHTAQTGDAYARLGAPAGASVSADVAAIKGVLPAALVSGRIDASVGAMANNVMTAAAAASDLTTELQTGLATAAALATVAGYVDTEIAAIISTLGTPSGASLSADVAAVKAQTAAIETDTGTDIPATLATVAGYLDTEIAAIKAKTDNLPSDPADASDIAGAFSTVNGTLSTLGSDISTMLGYVDTEIAAILAIANKLDTALELDGAVYRWTTNALEQAPSGGGGTSDWTADQRTALSAILGIPGSGTTPDDPSSGILDTIRDLVALVKAKTDGLPSDPADASVVAGLISALEAKVDTVNTVVDAVKVKTDALPTDPADASVVAGLIAAVEAKVDTVDTVVGAVKVKTDNLPSDPADASVIAGDFASVMGALSAIAAYVDTEVAAIKTKTDNLPASPAASGDVPSAVANAAAVLAAIVEGTTTLVQSIRLMNAANAGKASGLDTTNVLIRDLGDTKNRIDATVDANGNRSAVTLDLS